MNSLGLFVDASIFFTDVVVEVKRVKVYANCKGYIRELKKKAIAKGDKELCKMVHKELE